MNDRCSCIGTSHMRTHASGFKYYNSSACTYTDEPNKIMGDDY